MTHDPLETIGSYQTRKVIGKGGMGEVLLAFDPAFERLVAIKRIRPELKKHAAMRRRFLHEAKITASLTHPGVITVYTIHEEDDELYYVMPYIQGQTLKERLQAAHAHPHDEAGTINALLPLFSSVCQTLAYAHSHGILHRDVKPENVLVGQFGEVIVLDWGLAIHANENQSDEDLPASKTGLTQPGKLVGTVAYMAPERAHGAPASRTTDIYALGVILYQILTLHFPFKRGSLKEFIKNQAREKWVDPQEVAPYRAVSPRLTWITSRCLDPDPANRYESVEKLLEELKGHMEGRSSFFPLAHLDPHKKSDWLFQEHILISQYVALTQTTEKAGWVNLMISKGSFAQHLQYVARVRLEEGSTGVGFLIGVPQPQGGEMPQEGFCFWIGSELAPQSHLFRNNVEVMLFPQLFLKNDRVYEIIIEKSQSQLHLIIDGQHHFTYRSYVPLFGTHVGFVSREAHFRAEELTIQVGSQDLQVSCLSVPDAFLASCDFERALEEYRRIGHSFPGHTEGREALFRAGITLLEKAHYATSKKKKSALYASALEEFANLHKTPGAPLEYLGKALVYQSLDDPTEEIKCLELGLRRYKHTPLVEALETQVRYRMHEASNRDRQSAYRLILIALRLLPSVLEKNDSKQLFAYLVNHWEPLPFFEVSLDLEHLDQKPLPQLQFAAILAFWIAAPYSLLEIFQEMQSKKAAEPLLHDLLFSLLVLGCSGPCPPLVEEAGAKGEFAPLFSAAPLKEKGPLTFRVAIHLMKRALLEDREEEVALYAARLEELPLEKEEQISLDALRIWALLKEEKSAEAGAIFESYALELLNQESTELYPLYGCYLALTEGEEMAELFFQGVTETPFPRSWALLAHELCGKITKNPAWYRTSFLWERRILYQHLTLYYGIVDNPQLETYYRDLEKKEYVYLPAK